MAQEVYEYFSSVHEDARLVNKNPVSYPMRVDRSPQHSVWQEIEDQTKAFYEYSGGHLANTFVEKPENLVTGTFHLVNFIINRKPGEQIDTLLFLDKSARNAAYLFQEAWRITEVMLEEANLLQILPEKPLIRFINVGQFENNKHSSANSLAMLSNIYRGEDFSGNVLIVDEIISSGHSIKRTAQALTDAGYQPSSIEGIANFVSLPDWYYQEEAKGINDVGTIFEETWNVINHMSFSDLMCISDEIALVGADKLIESINLAIYSGHFLNSRKVKISRAAKLILDLVRSDQIEPKQLVNYVASKGGFLGLPPTTHQTQVTRKYREALTYMLSLTMDSGLVSLHLTKSLRNRVLSAITSRAR